MNLVQKVVNLPLVGRNRMTTFIKILLPTILLIISNNLEAQAPTKKDKKVDAKCFVELVGGGEAVVFWNISSKKLSALPDSIIGHKVALPSSRQKVEIYKVHECALLKGDFKGSKARIVDENTAR